MSTPSLPTLVLTLAFIMSMMCNIISLAVSTEPGSHSNATEYRVTIRTGDGYLAGTDSIYTLEIMSAHQRVMTMDIDGEGAKLERLGRDVFVFHGKDVLPIDRMILQRKEVRGMNSDWFVRWIVIEANESKYVFDIERWVMDDKPKNLIATLGACPSGSIRIQICKKQINTIKKVVQSNGNE